MIDTENSKVYQTTTSSNQHEKSWYKKSLRFPNALQAPDKSVIKNFTN